MVIAITTASSYGQAQSLADYYRKIFVMPGPVITGHAQFEQKCASCHLPANYREIPDKLCVSCHKLIGSDISQGRGFHGRRVDVRNRACVSCHTDHKGRDVSISGLDQELFNHDLTNFKLVGPHRAQSCGSCHAPNEKFRKAGSKCTACHIRLLQSTSGSRVKDKTKILTQANGTANAQNNNPRRHRAGKTSDPHFGRLPDCATCHRITSWTL